MEWREVIKYEEDIGKLVYFVDIKNEWRENYDLSF